MARQSTAISSEVSCQPQKHSLRGAPKLSARLVMLPPPNMAGSAMDKRGVANT